MLDLATKLMVFTLLLGGNSYGYEIIAFHGLNQSLRADAQPGPHDCTAQMVNKEDHRYIENTLPSLAEAFQLGATIGHFNIRRTADDKLVAFHDEDLSCRTNGQGTLKKSQLEYLKTLDVGFGYSPDKGLTFPTRGLGEGLMPTFEEIVATFPDRQFAINDKDADTKMVQIFLLSLSGLPLRVRQNIIYLGEAAEEIKSRFPEIQTVGTRKQHTTCIEWWLALGWTGYIHPSCKNTIIALPIKYAHKLSWVLRSFIDDLHSENSKFWIWDVNSPEDAKFAKSINPDAIGTYRIDKTIDVLK